MNTVKRLIKSNKTLFHIVLLFVRIIGKINKKILFLRSKNKFQYLHDIRIIRKEISTYKKERCFDFNGAKLPRSLEISPDSFFNVILPHVEIQSYNCEQIKAFYSKIKSNYSSLIYWRDVSNSPKSNISKSRELAFFSHGFTYFYNNITVEKDDVVFDLGAAPGDFSSVAIAKGAKIVFAFEPSVSGQKTLEVVSIMNDSKICIIPYFVGKQSDGVAVITLDDFAKTNHIENISFIKMDIEGAEVDAVFGAKNIIKNLCPKLAICTYHNPNDNVKIIKLVMDFNPKYKLIDYGGIIYGSVPMC